MGRGERSAVETADTEPTNEIKNGKFGCPTQAGNVDIEFSNADD